MTQAASSPVPGRGWWSFVICALLLVAAIGVMLRALPGPAATRAGGDRLAPGAGVDWPTHGGDPGHTQYAAIGQITPENVERLEVAWTYRTGDARPDRSQIQCNPIVVRGTLYATSPQLKVFALDAATGRERWVFDPFTAGKAEASALGVNRGVVYWEAPGGGEARILVTAGQSLFALDAATGQLIAGFGVEGAVDLRAGLGRDVQTL
jgi:quinoprotein glucose dehydrogenase